jgi:hypothetical protein
MTTTLININGDIRDASSLNVPKDRTFRGAWKFEGDAVEIDMSKAKNLHRDKLRQARTEKFTKLDSDWFRADETGDAKAKAEVAAKKKALRDVTADARIESASTPEELQTLTLEALTGL